MKPHKIAADLLFFLPWLCMAGVAHSFPAMLSGKVLEKGTRKPLANINVFILPAKLKATTNEKGEFSIEVDSDSAGSIIINATDYLKYERPLDGITPIDPSVDDPSIPKNLPQQDLTISLERQNYQNYGIVTKAKNKKRDASTKTLTQDSFLTAAGSNGDPVRAVQNLPGVQRPRAFSAQVLIQGAGPTDTKYNINGHEVPIVFHAGGYSSVLFPEIVERVDTLAAGYGVEYGRAQGGIVGLTTRSPRDDRIHGTAFIDTINAGLLLDGPIHTNGRLLLAGRTSYVGAVLSAVLPESSDFDLTVAPSFSDLTAVYEWDINPQNQLSVTATGSLDTLEFLLKKPMGSDPAIRGGFESKTSFWRMIPEWTHSLSEQAKTHFSIGFGNDLLSFTNNDQFLRIETFALTTRGELEWTPFTDWTTYFGFDNKYTNYDVGINLPPPTSEGGVSNPFSTGDARQAEATGTNANTALYWRNSWRVFNSPITLGPSLRLDRFRQTNETIFQPRFQSTWDAAEFLKIRAAYGLYAQPPQEQETDATFGNPDLLAPQARHATVGFDTDLRGGSSNGIQWNVDLFHRDFTRLPVRTTELVTRNDTQVPLNFRSNGTGTAYGAQTELRLDYNDLQLRLIYTLSRSTRIFPPRDEALFAYDQTHLLGLIGSYQAGNWLFSARFRASTGNPNTPVSNGRYDTDRDVYIPIRGEFYSERLDPFMQLDLRIDKRWVFDNFILTAYIDVQNVTNAQNIESIRYSYDYREKSGVSGLPILPSFGLKGEF